MNFSSIQQYLKDIDYSFVKPQTYFVFVPGLSLIIQKIQFANTQLINSNSNSSVENAIASDAKARKFANICKWHLRGSMIQMIASVIAIKFFTIPLLSLVTILSTYEAIDTLIKSLRNRITLYQFYPNGNVKTMTSSSACNIF